MLPVLALQTAFTVTWLVLLAIVLGIEAWAARRRQHGDTISEHWWWLQGRFPVAARVVYVLGLAILSSHLLVHWP